MTQFFIYFCFKSCLDDLIRCNEKIIFESLQNLPVQGRQSNSLLAVVLLL